MKQEFKKVDHEGVIYTVQLIKALDGKGIPFSAFVIFNKEYFDNLNFAETLNLSRFQDNILYIKKGHTVSQEEENGVTQLIENYNFDHIIRSQTE